MINVCELKDGCRKNLVKYLLKAIEYITIPKNPRILDIGCGTGVSALTLVEHLKGIVYCVDNNLKSLSLLIAKAKQLNLSSSIITFHQSAMEMDFQKDYFDLTIAEGILNIIGFDEGFKIVSNLTKPNGYIIIHDDYAEQDKYRDLAKKYNLNILNSFIINEKEWWELYFKPLYGKILPFKNTPFEKDIENEFNVIESFLENPLAFRSIYIILKK